MGGWGLISLQNWGGWLDFTTLSGGWGRLLTLGGGHATPDEVLRFLSGWSLNITVELFGSFTGVSNSVGEAIQVGLSSGVDVGISGGYGYTHTSGPGAVNPLKCLVWVFWCYFDS